MYTQGGEYGTLSNVTLEHNWIYANGHGDYEDGIVDQRHRHRHHHQRPHPEEPDLPQLLLRHPLRRRRHGQRLRRRRTPSTRTARARPRRVARRSTWTTWAAARGRPSDANIFNAGNRLINNCYDAAGRGFSIEDNVLNGQSRPLRGRQLRGHRHPGEPSVRRCRHRRLPHPEPRGCRLRGLRRPEPVSGPSPSRTRPSPRATAARRRPRSA